MSLMQISLYIATGIGGHATLKMLRRKSKTQNANFKTSAQYAKRNCTFELFTAHCTATINAKNISFHKKFFKYKEDNHNCIK
jgi:hypothetical protein